MAKIFSIDSLKNFVANLGTDRDKASASHYHTPTMTDIELLNAYRGSWLPRKIVDIPALDATRKWRNWQAGKDQINAIEAEEKRLGVRGKVLDAMTKARLFGGSGIYISIKGERDPSLPLSPEKVERNGIDFLTVIQRRELTPEDIGRDPAMPDYGKPTMYTVTSNTGITRIHPSRIVRFVGAEHPDEQLADGVSHGWGDSILMAAYEAVRNADATTANIASLIFEAKVDVLGIPGLTEIMADRASRDLLVERAQLTAMIKGNNGMLIRDAEETYDTKTQSFSNLDSIANLFMQVVSGAADIPMTRLFGQSPGGLNASGESDLRNYYDRVQSLQELEITPAMSILDECLIRSALGSRPDGVHYVWASLWQTTEKERSESGKRAAETVKILADTRLFPDDMLSMAAENMLIELSVMPGLEAARSEYDAANPEGDDLPPEGDGNDNAV